MNKNAQKNRMLSGELYSADDPELIAERTRAKALCHRYNRGGSTRDLSILAELFGYETDAYLEPPFYCDYGYNISLGKGVYANHNLVLLDCAPIAIGDHTLIGPNVVFSTAGHPVEPDVRARGLEFAQPIRMGKNVWIGANVTILPGVEIGENSTIGAGSVVTRPIPPNSVAVGNPCRVIREL